MSKRLSVSRHNLFALVLGLSLALAHTGALAALDGYATIVGETQGIIGGDVDIGPHAGKIRIKGFGSSVSADFDMDTGLPTGGQQHRPIRILKNVDPASPHLLNALVTNETLTTVTFEFIRPDDTGGDDQFFTVQLLNAHVVSILPSHSSTDEDSNIEINETVSLTYEKMIVTWEGNGILGEADW